MVNSEVANCNKFKMKEKHGASMVNCLREDMTMYCAYCKYIPFTPVEWNRAIYKNKGENKETAPKNTLAENKQNLDLIPWDLLAEFLPNAYEEGLIKYYKESWKKGFLTCDMFAATMRHLIAYRSGEDYDPAAAKLGIKKHHLAGALFSILCMLDTFKNHKELDDRKKDHRPEGWRPEMMQAQINKQLKRMEEK